MLATPSTSQSTLELATPSTNATLPVTFQQVDSIHDADNCRVDCRARFSCRRCRCAPALLHNQNCIADARINSIECEDCVARLLTFRCDLLAQHHSRVLI